MDFALSEKIETILAMIDEFVEKELIPLEPYFLNEPYGERSIPSTAGSWSPARSMPGSSSRSTAASPSSGSPIRSIPADRGRRTSRGRVMPTSTTTPPARCGSISAPRGGVPGG